MSASPLEGIRVLEIGQFVAAPYACQILADLGAEVIKIEPPEGDGIRAWGPHLHGESAPYMAYNRGKRSAVIDFRQPNGREAILRLYDRVDAVIENNRPGVLRRYGIDADVALDRNSRLIFCSITGYGSKASRADRPGFDLIIQGVTGIMSVTGPSGGAPTKVGVPLVDGTSSLHAVVSVLAALHERRNTQRGAFIDISLQATSMSWMMLLAAGYFATGVLPEPRGSAHPFAAPYQAFRASDAYITLAVGNDRQWQRLCDVLALDDLRDDDRFRTNALRAENQTELAQRIEAKLGAKPCDEWVSLLQSSGIPADRLNTLAEAIDDPTLRERGTIIESRHPVAGLVKAIGSPLLINGNPLPVTRSPLLGEDTQDVLREIGLTVDTPRSELGEGTRTRRVAGDAL